MSLLLEIAHCPVAESCLRDKTYQHGCAPIVRSQAPTLLAEQRLPEPWRGRLETAPILFLPSNPGMGEKETVGWPDPRRKDSDGYITDYFENCFDFDTHIPLRDYNRVRLWTAIRARATELLGWKAVPGRDFAVSDVVHCKSPEEFGVDTAVGECTRRWLRRVLELAAARIVVVMGRHAEDAVKAHLQIAPATMVLGPRLIGTKSRYVAFLPLTNHRGPRTFATCLPDDLATLQTWLRTT